MLLTFDKDFGELAFRRGLAASPGIVLFRVEFSSGAQAARFIVAVLGEQTDWLGSFAVVEEGRVRLRPLTTLPPT